MIIQIFPIQMYRGANSTLPLKGQPTTIILTNLVEIESSMLYTKIQPQSFLCSGEKDFKAFLPNMDMAVIFFQWRVTIQTNCQYPFDRRPIWNLVKTAKAVSEKKTFENYTIVYIYIAQEQGRITPGDKLFILTIWFYCFNHTL